MANDWLTWAFRALMAAALAYMVNFASIVREMQTEQARLHEQFEGYKETRTLIVEKSARDRAQLNVRVAAIESERVITADMVARLRVIEGLIRQQAPAGDR